MRSLFSMILRSSSSSLEPYWPAEKRGSSLKSKSPHKVERRLCQLNISSKDAFCSSRRILIQSLNISSCLPLNSFLFSSYFCNLDISLTGGHGSPGFKKLKSVSKLSPSFRFISWCSSILTQPTYQYFNHVRSIVMWSTMFISFNFIIKCFVCSIEKNLSPIY